MKIYKYILMMLLPVMMVLAGDVPFSETFDAMNVGSLHGQNDWKADRQSDARVQASTVYAGAQAGLMGTNTLVWQSFTNSAATNVWVDYYSRISYPADATPPTLTGSVAAAFFVTDTGSIKALSNTTWVTFGSYTVPNGSWQRFSVNLDYQSSKWGLYVAGDIPNELSTMIATNLAFSSSSTNTYFKVFKVKN
jgi:hypothetical protein